MKSSDAPPPLYTPESIAHCRQQDALGFLVVQAKHRLGHLMEQELEALDLTSAQFSVLIHLFHQKAIAPAEFCRLLDYDPGAMTRLLDRIEKKGFIRRTPHPHDARSILIELTESGRELYPLILPRVSNTYNRLLTGFTREEARQLEHLLRRILQNGH
jgi:DNA-binding MarR family transcriptional regulator